MHALAQGLATSLPEDLVRGSLFMQEGYNGPQTAQIAASRNRKVAIVFLVKQRFLGLPSLAAVKICGVFGRDARAAGRTISSCHAQRPITCDDRRRDARRMDSHERVAESVRRKRCRPACWSRTWRRLGVCRDSLWSRHPILSS